MVATFRKYQLVTLVEGEIEKPHYNIAGVYYPADHFKCKACGAVVDPVQINHETLSVFGSMGGGIFGLHCKACNEIRAEEGVVFKVA